MQISNFQLDWLSFTYQDNDSYDLLNDFWNIFPELSAYRQKMVICSGRNYSNGLCLDSYFTIRYDNDNNGKGINVEIPSHGLSYFFGLMGVDTVRDMFNLLNDRGCLPSRLDLCFDDYTMKYTPRYYNNRFEARTDRKAKTCLVTRMSTHSFVTSGKTPIVCSSDPDFDYSTLSETFYLGDRSRKMLRIYNKKVESGGLICSIRYELEIHNREARRFFKHIIDNPSDSEVVAFGDLILSFMSIRKKGNVHNIDKWDYVTEWYNFIKSTFTQRCISIPVYNSELDAQSIEKHAWNQSSSVHFMMCRYGDEYLRQVCEGSLNADHVRVLKCEAERLGLPPDFYIDRGLKLLSKIRKGVYFNE